MDNTEHAKVNKTILSQSFDRGHESIVSHGLYMF